MKFMKEQDHEILKLEGGELCLKAYPDAIGEIMLYDGSFRIAINSRTWDLIKSHAVYIIDERFKKEIRDNPTNNHITHNCKAGAHESCYGKSNAWGECHCECHLTSLAGGKSNG